MKKVGILTYHFTENYGATLQAFALWQTVKQQGYDVEFIDYRPQKLLQAYIKHLYFNKRYPLSNLSNMLKSLKTRQFLKKNTQLSHQRCYSREKLASFQESYDAIICGSDEIWNIESPLLGLDPSYFLDFVSSKTTRKISYAPSFGTTRTLGNNLDKISHLIQDFSAVSVRDTNSQKLIEAECEVQAYKVLDPTMLGDYSRVTQIPTQKDYILLYGNLNATENTYIQTVSRITGLPIISIGYPCKVAHQNRVGVGPAEWLGYFASASYIFTGFFHGTIFSILFRKPFAVFERSDKSIKVRDLLGELGLTNRILTKEMITVTQPKAPDTLELDEEKMKKLIDQSKNFLTQALQF